MSSGYQGTIRRVRITAAVALVGLWEASAALGGPLLVTAALTLAAALLGWWATGILRMR